MLKCACSNIHADGFVGYEETESLAAEGRMGKEKNGNRGEWRFDGTTGTRRTRRRSRDSCRSVSRSSGLGDRLLGASTRRRWLTLTARSTSNTFTGAAHASQPFGGKPSQSARPTSGAGLVWRLSRAIGRGASRPSTSSSSWGRGWRPIRPSNASVIRGV